MVNKKAAYSGSQVGCRSCKSPVSVTTSGSDNVFINGQSALRMGDTFAPYVCPACLTSSPGSTVTQSLNNSIFINGKQFTCAVWKTDETRINNLIIKPGKDCRNPKSGFYI